MTCSGSASERAAAWLRRSTNPLRPAEGENRARSFFRWGAVVAFACIAAEALYVLLFNLLVPPHLVSVARARGLTLQVSHLRSLYPGNIRVGQMSLADPRGSFVIKGEALSGRFGLLAALRGSAELEWIVVDGMVVKLEKPREALALLERDRGASPVRAVEASVLGGGTAPRFRIVRGTLELRSLEVAGLHLQGPTQVHVATSDAKLGERMSLSARLSSIRVRPSNILSPAALVTLDGSVKVEAMPEGRKRSRLVVQGAAHWKSAELGALLGVNRDLSSTDGSLIVELTFMNNALASGSSLNLSSGELRSPPVAFAPAGALFHELELKASLAEQAESNAPRLWDCDLKSPRVDLTLFGESRRFSLHARSRVGEPLENAPSTLTFSDGNVQAQRLPVPDEPAADRERKLELALNGAHASFSEAEGFAIAGALAANGSDAGSILRLTQADPALLWMLSELNGTPFEMDVDLSIQPSRIAFEGVNLTTKRDAAHGALYMDGGGARGAFLVRRGRFQLGVHVAPSGMTLDTGVNGEWLSRSLQEIGLASSG